MRQEILDAARDLFVREGYDHVSIRKIAAKLEISPGSLYLHFDDKISIFEHLCRETFDRLSARMKAIVDDPAPALDRLRRAGRLYVEFGLENPQHYMLTFVLGGRLAATPNTAEGDFSRIKAIYMTAGFECLGRLHTMAEHAIAEGALRFHNPAEVTQILWSGLHGLTSNMITKCDFPWIERTRLVDSMVDVLLEGVRSRPTAQP